jgi:hypothetical protein
VGTEYSPASQSTQLVWPLEACFFPESHSTHGAGVVESP